jgi:hypothetical protein
VLEGILIDGRGADSERLDVRENLSQSSIQNIHQFWSQRANLKGVAQPQESTFGDSHIGGASPNREKLVIPEMCLKQGRCHYQSIRYWQTVSA